MRGRDVLNASARNWIIKLYDHYDDKAREQIGRNGSLNFHIESSMDVFLSSAKGQNVLSLKSSCGHYYDLLNSSKHSSSSWQPADKSLQGMEIYFRKSMRLIDSNQSTMWIHLNLNISRSILLQITFFFMLNTLVIISLKALFNRCWFEDLLFLES